MMKRKLTLILLLIMTSGLVTACGDKSDADSLVVEISTTESDTESIKVETSEMSQETEEYTTQALAEDSSIVDVGDVDSEDADAKALYEAAVSVFQSIGFTGSGTYQYGTENELDELMKNQCDYVNNYSDIYFYLYQGEVLSVACHDNSSGTIRYETYPTPCTEDMIFSDYSILYLAMDSDGKIKFNNEEAYQLGLSIDSALWDMSSEGNALADGEYGLKDCGDLCDYLANYLSISRFDSYKNVSFKVYTNEYGNQQSAVLISVDGEFYGGFPNETTIDNYSNYTLDDARAS